MAPGRRRGGSCWTCRLRRKRCNLARPVCGNCQHLEITCHSGKAKPSWMDGGAGQKHMSEAIKRTVKHNALLRRERRLLVHANQGSIVATNHPSESRIDVASALVSRVASCASDSEVERIPSTDSPTSSFSTSSVELNAPQSSNDESEEPQSTSTTAHSTCRPVTLTSTSFQESSGPVGSAMPIQMQLGSVMIYLDYVFPFLFPFYHPSLTETGRQWLLGLLCQNEVFFHIAASLSAYFFTLAPRSDGQNMHDECKALVRDRLLDEMRLAVSSIQSNVYKINHHGEQSPLLDRVRIMQEIVQLLIVEVAIQSEVSWSIHLTPALVLFDEIFKTHGNDRLGPNLTVLLNALPSPTSVAALHHKPTPNTADQSALVFFVSLLLFLDVVASTSLATPPVLQCYHHILLSPFDEKCSIRLETVIGCQNWALVAIGHISNLCAWKRQAKQSGSFSVVKLVHLASPVSQALEEGLAGLETDTLRAEADRLESYYSRHDKIISDTAIANITRIWAYAAQVYLAVTLSGWQAKSDEIQTNVAKLLAMVQSIESPAQLRSLSWPITVAGCLALPSQEQDFRLVFEVMGQLRDFGTASDALRIIEAVWNSRETIDADVWDITSSLNILGSSALLL